jgi:DNA-binding beta-propeller fold protein YncE
VAVDPVNDELFVADGAGNITVYARTAVETAPPLRKLSGTAPLAVDPKNDEIFVGASNGEILVYPRTAVATSPPLRRMSGRAAGLNSPVGMALGQ